MLFLSRFYGARCEWCLFFLYENRISVTKHCMCKSVYLRIESKGVRKREDFFLTLDHKWSYCVRASYSRILKIQRETSTHGSVYKIWTKQCFASYIDNYDFIGQDCIIFRLHFIFKWSKMIRYTYITFTSSLCFVQI